MPPKGAREPIVCLAPAKVNLTFKVVGRREDGYHLVESLMAPVSLYDRVEIAVSPAQRAAVGCRVYGPERVAGGPDNLAARAAWLLLRQTRASVRVSIKLHKYIPVGSGLGGGSSDAGAVLRALPRLLGASISSRRLGLLATSLGADIPFFLGCRPAMASGIGELLEPLAQFPPLHLVVAVPEARVSTHWAYANALPRLTSRRSTTRVPCFSSQAKHLRGRLFNDFERGVRRHVPEVSRVAALLEQLGAVATVMSGSGSAMVGVFGSAAEARRAAEGFPAPDKAFAVRVIRRAPAVNG